MSKSARTLLPSQRTGRYFAVFQLCAFVITTLQYFAEHLRTTRIMNSDIVMNYDIEKRIIIACNSKDKKCKKSNSTNHINGNTSLRVSSYNINQLLMGKVCENVFISLALSSQYICNLSIITPCSRCSGK